MDYRILELAGKTPPRVAIIPTAAASENPQLAAANGIRHFSRPGRRRLRPGRDTRRADAENPRVAAQVNDADLIYFTGGSPEHLRSVLADSALLAGRNRRLRQRRNLGRLQRRRNGNGRGDAPSVRRLPGIAGPERHRQRNDACPTTSAATRRR